MTKEPKKPKHHRLCIRCKVQTTGKSIKECEETFPQCGLTGGNPNDACKTTILQDGKFVFELIKKIDLTKLKDYLDKAREDLKKLKSSNKAKPSKVEPTTPETTPPTEDSKDSKNSQN